MREDVREKKRLSKKNLVLWAAVALLLSAVLFFGTVAFLERETIYTYEEISSRLVLHEIEGGFWAEASLYPETGFAMSNETISVDEENKIRYMNLYVYMTTKAKNRYFEDASATPFMALWDNGHAWAPISNYDFDGQGNLIKPEVADSGAEYRVIRRVYYAHFERNYDELILHTDPVLIWSSDSAKG